MPETIIYRKSFFCIRCLGSKWAASLFRNFCMIFAETVERQNKAFKMLDLPGIKFVLSLSFLAYANAQFTNVCTNNVNPCPGSTECFNRPLPPNADPSTLAYVCDCGSSFTVGDDCSTTPPGFRSDRPQESFITCYGDSCSTGSFQSLNYPNLYEDRWTAIYLLYIPRASRIDFTFTGDGGFGIETLKDELYVGTGLSFSSNDFTGVDIVDGNRVVRFFDNSTLNGQTYPPPFSFETDSVWLYFLTDKNIMFNGWQLSWTSTVDNTPPTVSLCPGNMERVLERGDQQFVSIIWTEPIANDISGPVTSTQSHTSGTNFFIGTTTVTYTFFDRHGNFANCIFDVTVIEADSQPPVVSGCPDAIMREVELGTTEIRVDWIEPTAVDVPPGPVDLESRSFAPGSSFPAPTTLGQVERRTVSYVFADANLNRATCVFTVSVTAVDNTPPVISGCPGVQSGTVEIGTNEQASIVWTEPTATDLSRTSTLIQRTHPPGSLFASGTTSVTYTFADSSTNEATCQFNVVVTTVDTTPPMCVDNPATIFETVELGMPGFLVRWTPPTCNDLSGTAFVNAASATPPTFFSADTTTPVTHTCVDLSGNEETCSFSVIIQTVDTTPPTIIDGPNSITRTIELGENGIVVTWAEPSSQDISGTQILISQSHFSNTQFGIGNTLVTYVYGDESGNTATHMFCVNVQTVDRIPPTIANCPTSGVAITVELGETSGPAFWQAITATDLSNVADLVSQTNAPGDSFMLGMTTVMYIFADASGNPATCSFTVTVTPVDTLPPVISGCPGVIREVVELGSQGTIVLFPPPTATDFSGVATVTPSHRPGVFFEVGMTSVTYRFEDATGNFDECTFVINVVTEDTTAPECVGLPATIELTVELGMQGSMVTWVPPTCSDNGFAFVSGSTSSPGTFFMVDPTGTLVTYTCTDNVGLSTDCSFRVIVTTEDTIAPMCQDVPVNTIGTVELGTGTETTVTWRPPMCVDLSPTTQVSSASPGDLFSIGTTTVTVTCFDSSGNNNNCDFMVTVIEVDNTAPQCVGVPAGASAEVELGMNTQTVTWIEPTCIDASGTAVLTSTSSPGSSFPVGVTPVIYTCTDGSGNVGTCSSFDVVVVEVDTIAPTIMNCPVAGSVGAVIELGMPNTMVAWPEPTAADRSGTSVAQRSHAPGSSFPVGDTTVTYIFQDSAGNTAPCQFTVSVTTVDTMPPVITGCPNMASTTVELGINAGVVTWIEPTATDFSGVAVLSTSGGVTGDMFPVGQTVVMYTFVDNSGNAAVCTIIVTVGTVDTRSPDISGCPTNEVEQVELGTPGTTVTWTEPTATDASGRVSLQVRTHAPGTFFLVGNSQVNYTFSDPDGNEAVCAFTVSVVEIDTIGPTCVGAPANGVIETVELGQPGAIASWATISCDDRSGVAFVSDSTRMSGSFFTLGDSTVTVTCQDGSGNTGTCSFTVTIVATDTVEPTCARLPGNVFQTVELGMQTVEVTWVAPICDDLSPTTGSSSRDPGDSFPVGDTEVVFTCIDSAGNQGSCSFTVTVQEVDTTDPQCVGLPVGVGGTAEVGGIPGAMVSWIPPTCVDLSTTTIQGSTDPGAFFPLGSTTVVYTCTDAFLNQGQCSFDVIVTTVDTTPPMCTGLPADILRFVELGSSGDSGVTWSLPTCADASNSGRILTSSADPLDFFPIGTTVVTYTCIDDASLTSTCSFVVDIQNVDTTPPTITGCPDNQEIIVELGITSERAFWTVPTATDLSGLVTIVGTPPQPGQSVMVGTMTVLYTFQDLSMNQAFCQFTITVTPVDRTPPDITGCPVVVEEVVELGMTGTIVTWTAPTATDISGLVSLITPTPPSFFVVGLTTVTYTFADGSGNQNTCTFMVRVIEVDTTPPAISNCPPDQIVTIELGDAGRTVSWLEPTASDLSGTERLISRSNPPDSFFRVGDTTVTYVFQDASGNENNCSFVVTVTPVDSMPPDIVGCPADIEVIIELGTTRAMVDWIEPFSSDVSGTETLISRSHAPGEQFIIGRTTVVYIFGDSSGNTDTCSFSVIVTAVDTTPPTISNCRTDSLDVTVEFGATGTTVQWPEPTATDISSVTLSSRSESPNNFFPVGQTMVTYVFTDDAGNTATCEFCIIVLAVDTVAPVCVGVPSDVFENVELGIQSAVVSWTEPTCQDSDVAFLSDRSATSPSPFAVDQRTEVTFTCSDPTGNTGTCSFFVTVSSVDRVPPAISGCPGDISRTVELGLAGIEVSWVPPTATDISGTVNLQPVARGPGSFFPVAQTPITYRFSDQSGNFAECTFLVIVTTIDTTPPVVADCPTPDIRREVELGTPSLIIAYPEPTATDLSEPVNVVTNCRSGDTYTVGETLCTYTFSDRMGNPSQCIFTIIVTSVDTTPPVCADLPGPIVEVVELGTTGAVLFWTPPSCTDPPGAAFIFSSTASPGDFFPVGARIVEYICQDSAGLTTTCTFPVTVTTVDTTPPTVVCTEDVAVTLELGDAGRMVSWVEPTATDISNVASLQSRSHAVGTFFTDPSTTVSYIFIDSTGNTATCSFCVRLQFVDTTDPQIDCPVLGPVVVEILSGGTTVTWLPVTATDLSPTTVSCTHNPGDFFITGVTSVTCTAIDDFGNLNQCTFDVEVREVDSIPPVVTCPPDVSSVIEIGTGPTTINLPIPTVSDNSLMVPTLVTRSPPGNIFAVGVTPVTFTYRDLAGNVNSCTFTVTVTEVDTLDPIISGCPADITETTSLELRECRASWPEPQVSDNSGVVTIFDQSHFPNSVFDEGVTIVTYTYSDPTGNLAECSFSVTCTPVDEVPPIVTCPPTFQLQTSLEVPFCTVNNLPEAQATDNSGTVFVVSQNPPATTTQYNVGDTTVTITFQDPSGNQGFCTFTVRCIEVDDVLPVVTCPQDVTTVVIEGLPGTTVTFTEPLASDNSGTATISSITQQSNSFFSVGSTPVVVIATDPSGNTAQCTFNVIVQPGNPCDPNPCSNGGFCAIDSLSGFTCVCTECFIGTTCDISVDACANNQCQNGGACVAAEGACDHYRCECPPCFSGEFCQDFRDACENHQCQGGSTCCPDNNCLSYSCQCAPCFDGPYCETEINSCEIHNCQNNAQCVPDLLGDCSGYTCSCTGCFTGELCTEVMNACQPNPCLNGGFCSPDAVDCYRYNCRCNGCFTGTRCEIAIPDPCLPNPCLNGGICTNVGGSCSSFTCECQKGNIGILCETVQVDNTNPCNSFPCENGASCVESGSNYICLCRTQFAGINCGQTTASLTQNQLACSTNPCRNGALCVNSYHSASNNFVYEAQYTCRCSNQFTGEDCQNFVQIAVTFCNPNPCSNGGSCNNAYHSFMNEVDYVCTCPVGFRGQDCESDVGNPCDSSPCENGGTCTPFNTYFTCTCLTGFSGDYCQTASGVGPPINVFGCPADITMDAVGGSVQATWSEPNAFGGVGTVAMSYQSHSSGDFFTVGETPVTYVFTDSTLRFAECTFFVIVRSPNRCTPNPCQNGGRCLQSGSSLCDCTGTGFTGNTCQTPITVNRCIPNPCQNGGRCLQAGATLCDCTGTGFTGNTCQTSTVSATPCPADIVQTTNLALTPVTWVETTGGLFFITQRSSDSGDSFPIGQTTVTITYFDLTLSQILDCTFTINLIGAGPLPMTPPGDTIPPVFLSCPDDMIFDTLPPAAAGFDINIPWMEPTYDDEGGTIRANQTHSPGDSFRVGDITNVVYTIVDLAGNAATCEFVISLQTTVTGRRKRDVDITFTKQETEACPCLNGGVCLTVEDGRTSFCHCPEEYSGMLCEVDQTDGNGVEFNQQLPFVAVVGVLVIIIGILAIALCQVSKHLSRRKQMVKEDEVAIIN
ncbi:uncharacterized protein [Apostichopus japonicus]|uniref:uncharacterized protein isoform X4 n=1 Tax=Stichopus japonicus TaxID=307972 RepID=UPI003AB4FA58